MWVCVKQNLGLGQAEANLGQAESRSGANRIWVWGTQGRDMWQTESGSAANRIWIWGRGNLLHGSPGQH
eukprot:4100024-Karenia_brevis.AAC.1